MTFHGLPAPPLLVHAVVVLLQASLALVPITTGVGDAGARATWDALG